MVALSRYLYRAHNLKDDPHCVCGHLFEDAIHFFLECPLYLHDTTCLFSCFNNIVPISIKYILRSLDVTKYISEELNALLFKSVLLSSLVTENHQRTDVYFPAHAW